MQSAHMVCTKKHTWSVQQNIPSSAQCMHLRLPAKQNTPGLYNKTYLLPGLYSGCQYNKTYLVCTVAASTTTKHTLSVQSMHLWLSKQNPRDIAVRHDWMLLADDVLVFHFTHFAASQRQCQWQCNDSDLGWNHQLYS